VTLERVKIVAAAELRYAGVDATLTVPFGSPEEMRAAFEAEHRRRFGFLSEGKAIVVESISSRRSLLPAAGWGSTRRWNDPSRLAPRSARDDPTLPFQGRAVSGEAGWGGRHLFARSCTQAT